MFSQNKSITVTVIRNKIINNLRILSDRKTAESAQRFFREEIDCYGIRAADLMAIARDIRNEVKPHWSTVEVIELTESLLREKEQEAKACGLLILALFNRQLTPANFDLFLSWLRKGYLNNWALIDIFSLQVVSPIIIRDSQGIGMLEKWLSEDYIFVKRACLVSLIKLARKGQQTELIYRMVLEVSSARRVNDLVAKASGWLLREAGKADQHFLENFIEEHGWRLPRVSVRYAIERFPEIKRKYFLDITKKKQKRRNHVKIS